MLIENLTVQAENHQNLKLVLINSICRLQLGSISQPEIKT